MTEIKKEKESEPASMAPGPDIGRPNFEEAATDPAWLGLPRETALGLVGMLILAIVVPSSTLECAASFVKDGFDLWLSSIPYLGATSLLPLLIVIVHIHFPSYWTICIFFYLGAALLLAYGLSVQFAVISLLSLFFFPISFFPISEVGLGALNVVGLIMLLLVGAPAAWFLLRALRLRYWQPGSHPSEWRPGDER